MPAIVERLLRETGATESHVHAAGAHRSLCASVGAQPRRARRCARQGAGRRRRHRHAGRRACPRPIDGAFTRWDLTAGLREARRRFERDYIAAVLDHHQWRMSDAARALGLERANLYRKTRQLGIARGSPVQKCHEVVSHERATLVHAAPVQHRHPAGLGRPAVARAQAVRSRAPAIRLGPVEFRPRLALTNMGVDNNVFNEKHRIPSAISRSRRYPISRSPLHPGRLRLAYNTGTELRLFPRVHERAEPQSKPRRPGRPGSHHPEAVCLAFTYHPDQRAGEFRNRRRAPSTGRKPIRPGRASSSRLAPRWCSPRVSRATPTLTEKSFAASSSPKR